LLPECNLELEITGFDPAEIDALAADFTTRAGPADEIPVPDDSRAISRWAICGRLVSIAYSAGCL